MIPPALSVIVPTYNERDSLPILIDRLAHVAAGVVLEVVIVDDGSPDGTGALAEELARTAPMPIRVVHRPGKAGLASAGMDGGAVARGRQGRGPLASPGTAPRSRRGRRGRGGRGGRVAVRPRGRDRGVVAVAP